jgi:hypothetical protein
MFPATPYEKESLANLRELHKKYQYAMVLHLLLFGSPAMEIQWDKKRKAKR